LIYCFVIERGNFLPLTPPNTFLNHDCNKLLLQSFKKVELTATTTTTTTTASTTTTQITRQ